MMFLCAVCHATESHQAFVTEVFQIDDKPVMVEAEAFKAEARRRAEHGEFFGYMAYASLIARQPV